jgi:hypothetical protein
VETHFPLLDFPLVGENVFFSFTKFFIHSGFESGVLGFIEGLFKVFDFGLLETAGEETLVIFDSLFEQIDVGGEMICQVCNRLEVGCWVTFIHAFSHVTLCNLLVFLHHEIKLFIKSKTSCIFC